MSHSYHDQYTDTASVFSTTTQIQNLTTTERERMAKTKSTGKKGSKKHWQFSFSFYGNIQSQTRKYILETNIINHISEKKSFY